MHPLIRLVTRFALPLPLLALALPGRPLPSASVVIEDVTVVDVAAGALRPHMTAVIQGDRIVVIGRAGSVRVPGKARIVKGAGKYLTPGLWDMGVNLREADQQLPVFLAYGVTGVRDRGGDLDRVAAKRNQIERGTAVGPHIVTSGLPVGAKPSLDSRLSVLVADTPAQARQAFDELWNRDVDFIQIRSDISRDAYIALAEQARHWRLRLDGAIPAGVSAWEAVEARQGIIEDLSGLDTLSQANAAKFFERCALMGTRILPALARRSSEDSVFHLTALAKQEKVEILAESGTERPYTKAGVSLYEELSQLVAAGLDAREALESATLAPARLLGWDDSMGSVEEGKIADLLLLDANPLEDIRNTRRIAAVFARGRYYSRVDLDRILAAAK
jgi:imidazolonepropionase-like amidohydrolase